ncbi:hypothetical protein RRG08_057993 [Elysia crispata]|uniref:Uncharacterized protein n=1 Tax=Elysia crispata TaxID=231223 RepID=A0AAE1AH94_9GAST|nr:hypothetical protein RRG08_057993 [Elysia crispata]
MQIFLELALATCQGLINITTLRSLGQFFHLDSLTSVRGERIQGRRPYSVTPTDEPRWRESVRQQMESELSRRVREALETPPLERIQVIGIGRVESGAKVSAPCNDSGDWHMEDRGWSCRLHPMR